VLVARVYSSQITHFFYYFFTLLFLQYVNELFVGLQSPSNSRTAILSSPVTSNNAIIRWFDDLKIWRLLFSFLSHLTTLILFQNL